MDDSVDAQRFSFNDLEQPTNEILSDYAHALLRRAEWASPDEILFPDEMEWEAPLAEVLTEKRGRRVEVLTPQRGDKVRLIELSNRNAPQAFVDNQRETGAARTAVERLQRALHLRRPPERIGVFRHLSHFQGGQIVASLVRFDHGLPEKSLYRRYKIRTTDGQDDFKSMYEVLTRRARRGLEEEDLPDLSIVIDGGKGQLAAARAALDDDHGVHDVELISLAKSRLTEDEESRTSRMLTDIAVMEMASDDLAATPKR